MRHITPQHMVGFNDELSKEAGRIGDYLRRARGFLKETAPVSKAIGYAGRELKGKPGRQLMLGAGVGGAGGALMADPEEGESRLRGAMKGALLGGGLAGGALMATESGRQAAKKGVGDFLQRQRYSLTGRGLGDTPTQQMAKAREIGLVPKGAKGVDIDAFQKGYMSVPGVVHGLLSSPGDVLKSGWKRSGALGKAFAGLGAYQTGKGLIEKPEPGGPGRLEKGLRGAGQTVGWMVAPASLLGGHIVGEGLGKVTGSVGKVGDLATQMVRQRRAGQLAPAQGNWNVEQGRTNWQGA